MSTIEAKLHAPGIKIYRVAGAISSDDIENWRSEIEAFIKENAERAACGLLIDMVEAESVSTDALDGLMDILSEPDEVLDENVRMRFALIGVKPFTQRFFRESMSQNSLKNFRARFFHEVAEDEALAWLQAMVTTATEAAGIEDKEDKEKPKEDEKKPAKDQKGIKPVLAKKDDKKPEAEKVAVKKPEDGKSPEKKPEPVKSKTKVEDKKTGIRALLGRQPSNKEKAPEK